MTRLRRASFALVVLAAVLATGTGAFSTVGAERTFEVGVAEQDEALLGVENEETVSIEYGVNQQGDKGGGAGRVSREVELLTITNHHTDTLHVRVTTNDATRGQPPTFLDESVYVGSLQRGTDVAVRGDVVCAGASDEDELPVTITAETSDGAFNVTTTEEIRVECERHTPKPSKTGSDGPDQQSDN